LRTIGEIKGCRVLQQMIARIMPGKNSHIPDCMCYILLTEDNLFVVEDTYEGDFIIHFTISIYYTKYVGRYVGNDWLTQENFSEKIKSLLRELNRIISLLNSIEVEEEILMIVFEESPNEERRLYFNDVRNSIGRFAWAYRRLRRQQYGNIT